VIARCDVLDAFTVSITTRFAVSDLEAVLTSPALAPRRAGFASGAFTRKALDDHRTLLEPASRDHRNRPIELVTTASREAGREAFDRGALDIGWGIGVPAEFWSEHDGGPFAEPAPLDMFAVVVASRSMPSSEARTILNACRLERGTAYGVQPVDSRYGDEARSAQLSADGGVDDGTWPLYFTTYPPNEELAYELSVATAGRLRPRPVSYGALLQGRLPDQGFSLQIHSAATAGAVGVQIESASIASGLTTARGDLRERCLEMWAGGSSSRRRSAAIAVEQPLDRLLQRKVVGRFLTRFRTVRPFSIPRTGWFDFTQLRKQREST
jgi:hypothetical protein